MNAEIREKSLNAALQLNGHHGDVTQLLAIAAKLESWLSGRETPTPPYTATPVTVGASTWTNPAPMSN